MFSSLSSAVSEFALVLLVEQLHRTLNQVRNLVVTVMYDPSLGLVSLKIKFVWRVNPRPTRIVTICIPHVI
eukprot:m.86009 g.86009  ORF g.86009 m.86009 type:complete len:71 (+) comp25918_c0_seq2:542-754(+)